MGPPQAIDVLKNALAVGADKVYLLSDRAFAGADTLATAYTLAKTIEWIGGVDLVICGKQAIDGDTAQVGPGIATRLGIPQLTYVAKVREIDPAKKKIVVERMLEVGREVVESSLPAVITVIKDINEPRLPSLLGIKKAAKAQIPTWTAKDIPVDENRIGLKGSPTWVSKIFSPEARGGGRDPERRADRGRSPSGGKIDGFQVHQIVTSLAHAVGALSARHKQIGGEADGQINHRCKDLHGM